jgi:hypothetical protein
MAVSVTTADLPGYTRDHCARFEFTFDRTIAPKEADAWWTSVAPEVEERFRAGAADPPPPTRMDAPRDTLYITLPIPTVLLTDPDYDLETEVLPEVREAAIREIRRRRLR